MLESDLSRCLEVFRSTPRPPRTSKVPEILKENILLAKGPDE